MVVAISYHSAAKPGNREKKQPQPHRINIKVYLYKSLFSFLVLGLQTLSYGDCSYYLFGFKKSDYRDPASH